MNYQIDMTLDQGSMTAWQRFILQKFDQARTPVQGAMAEKFFEIVRMNFGDFGFDRPIEWAPLSPDYARRVGREHATLLVSGRLAGAVKLDVTEERGRVSVSDQDVPYALAHQYGSDRRNLPARPYFPIDENGNPMPKTLELVNEAAREALAQSIQLFL